MKRKILAMLREGSGYVSGQQICDALSVSRTAVWKVINALKAEGYEIEAVPNRGYRLQKAPDVLTEAEVGSLRRDIWKDAPLAVYAVTDSTNIQADRMAEEGVPEGTLAVADMQKSGRGRRGRSWETPAGISLAMSFILRPELPPEKASMLTLIAAMAGRQAVAEETGTAPGIKWPNDLVMNGKKICGILTEMKLEEGEIRQVVVGMGFNVNQTEFDAELAPKATSLLLETGVRWPRAELCCLVMKYFGEYYRQFLMCRDLSFLQGEYNGCLAGFGQEVQILSPGGDWRGISRGIDTDGALLVERNGKTEKVMAGEVSVRGIYGYV